jgi:hypothetical protein
MARKGKLNNKQTESDIERPASNRKYTYHILIACEDQTTEPEYFKEYKDLFEAIWPKKTLFLKPIGTGRNSLGVVQQAIEERSKLETNDKTTIDQTWAVFDKDDLDKSEGNIERFNEAFDLGKEKEVKIAYSNECFELWLLLYFEDINKETAIPRAEIYSRLEKAIQKHQPEFVYEHGNSNVVKLVSKYGNKKNALQRAEELFNYHKQEKHQEIESNPNTLVYNLVRELDDWLEYYRYE